MTTFKEIIKQIQNINFSNAQHSGLRYNGQYKWHYKQSIHVYQVRILLLFILPCFYFHDGFWRSAGAVLLPSTFRAHTVSNVTLIKLVAGTHHSEFLGTDGHSKLNEFRLRKSKRNWPTSLNFVSPKRHWHIYWWQLLQGNHRMVMRPYLPWTVLIK